ncbi:esterase [uncultured Pedobacter sp.]|uniref:esterase n=1 Tax=uncultured Pedobacter sp. TaxID=246139 RepID=UPI0025DA9F6D|nr:esterase [uncultured Pedobacter sp.]
MKKIILLVLLGCTQLMYAQENLNFGRQKEIISPQMNTDGTVTFRLKAPNARKVEIQGDFLVSNGNMPPTQEMKLGTDSVWSYTSVVLPSELYSYSFIVDGLKIRDPNNVYLIRDVSSVVNVFLVGNGKADLYTVKDVPHGTVAKRWYQSAGLKTSRRLTVYTPPSYEASKGRYPVLYLLHGVGGDEEAWMQLGRASQILDNLIASGKARPMIVVMANGHTSNTAAPGESSKGLYKPIMMTPDVFNGDMESYFKEIIDFTEKNYRTGKEQHDRAIAGLSMGGFHSLYISANYPKTFGYVGLFSPAILPPASAASPIYKDLDLKLEALKKNGYDLYWIAIGKKDFLYKTVREFRNKLDGIGLRYDYKESEGGHTWVNWRDYLSEFIPMLFK